MRDQYGAPVINTSGRGYSYDRTAGTFELPGLWFGSGELESLLVMDHLLDAIQPGVLRRFTDPLRTRLWEILDSRVPGEQTFPTNRIRILSAHARFVSTDLFILVTVALIDRRQLSFIYSGRATSNTTHRTVSPQCLVYYRDQWYLDAWDENKGALRTFSIDRISKLELLEIAAQDICEEELDTFRTVGYGLLSGPVRRLARMIFTPERSRWVADEGWHRDQSAKWLADGSYELTVPYADQRELMGEILRHGSAVRVVEPKSLVTAVRRQLERALRTYDSVD